MVVDKSPWPPTTGSRVRISELWAAFEPGRRYLVILGGIEPREKAALDEAANGSYTMVSDSVGNSLYDRLMAEAEGADVIWVSDPVTASVVGDLGTPTIVDMPSVQSRLLLNELAVRLRELPSRSSTKRLLLSLIGAPDRLRSERKAWDEADIVTPCSPLDQRRLPARVRTRSVLVPNGCGLRPLRAEIPRQPRLIFVGTLHYSPNAEAALLLAERILPSVRRDVPGLELDIVGSFPDAVGSRLSRLEAVTVHGFVDDLSPLYGAATHSVIPLRHSTGTNVKLLESIAHGVPVIATPAALSGLPALVPGRDVVVAPHWPECGGLLLDLIGDPVRSQALASSAWGTVEQHYTWERSRETLREAVGRLSAGTFG